MPTQTGTIGNDYLPGTASADDLIGLAGDDIYIANDFGDRPIEVVGEGYDTVFADVSFTLPTGSSLELLAARDNSLTLALALIGNELDNMILGNNGANFLEGGAGIDVLYGYGGNDTYAVDDSLDVVHESAGGGTDFVYTTVDYTLAAGSAIERFSARDVTTTDNLTLIGNEFANTIWGNAGNNFIDGREGADIMAGGGGSDTYIIDNIADQIEDRGASTDIDTLYVTTSYTLFGIYNDMEVLAAIDNQATTPMDLRGNGSAQTIMGNNGPNLIDGSSGNDVLIGFGGADTFVFTTPPSATSNLDFIQDFVSGVDRIQLRGEMFGNMTAGSLPASAFVVGTAAQDADDRIIYDQSHGALYFDADGNGSGQAIQFAQFFWDTQVAATDFTVI